MFVIKNIMQNKKKIISFNVQSYICFSAKQEDNPDPQTKISNNVKCAPRPSVLTSKISIWKLKIYYG